jgi:hypothetical protein
MGRILHFKSIFNQKNYLHLFVLSLVLLISLNINMNSSFADSKITVLPGFASIQHSDSIKLRSKGCQEIKFEYIIDEELQSNDSVILIQLVHKSKKIVYGGVVWFSELTYTSSNFPSMSRIGILPMKICRNSWLFKSNSESTKYTAVKPGLYDFYFSYGYLTLDGRVLGDKSVIRKSVKLVA